MGDWYLGWHNLIFLVPLGLALAYLFAYALSGWTFGEADLDVDHDVDVDIDPDLDIDHDVDAEHDVHAARPDIDADSDVGNANGVLAALTWLGVGRVPLSIVLMVLLLTFGLAGFAGNELLRNAMGRAAVWVSLPTAVVLSLAITSGVSQLIARYMPLNESSARDTGALVGRRGTVVFAVTNAGGTVVVHDAGGDRYQVAARTRDGTPPAPAGTEVVLADYDAATRTFLVRQIDL